MNPSLRSPVPSTPLSVSTSSGAYRLSFHGSGGELFGIFILNLLKTILTLGVYYFWAKVKTRQYLWGQTDFAGDRFGFHGTGKELLLGYLKAVVVFGGLVLIQLFLSLAEQKILALVVFWGGLIALWPLALMGAVRYRLSRTSWRGIRFSFRGEYQPFLGLFVRGVLLMALTLGLYYPFYQASLRRFLIGHAAFGSTLFTFDGQGKELFGKFILALLLTIPTLGLIWIWYTALQRRYNWGHTSVAEARFHSTVTGWGLFGLGVVNLLMIIFSLGLAIPWATVRTLRYDCSNLVLQGPLDLDSIAQQAQAATPAGEELADLLGIDVLPG